MQNSAFDSALPPLAGIDRFRVVNAENPHVAYFSRIRDAVTCAKMFRNIGAMVLDSNGTVLYTVGQ